MKNLIHKICEKNFLLGFFFGAIVGIFVLLLINGGPKMLRETKIVKGEVTQASSKCPDREPQNIEAPLLPPPDFSAELPDTLEASKTGGIMIDWVPVAKALRYEIVVTDERGKRVNRIKTPFTQLTLRDFRTGDEEESHFLVSVATANVDGKVGGFNKPRKIVVRERPDITAPTIKSIKTED